MKKENISRGSMLFTAVFSSLLVALMAFAFVFIALSPDFENPDFKSDGNSDDLIWYCNMDDLFDYFEEKGIHGICGGEIAEEH